MNYSTTSNAFTSESTSHMEPTTKPLVVNESASDGSYTSDTMERTNKRYLSEHKKPDAALTFPEKLMHLMKEADKHDPRTFCIAWLPDGKTFIIRDPEEFTKEILLKFFKAAKFSSFTRKLYRWGFRQVNRGMGPDDPIIFGNQYFQRNEEELISEMRSVTAAYTRKRKKNHRDMAMAKRARSEEINLPKDHDVLIQSLLQQKGLSNYPFLGTTSPNMNIATLVALRQQQQRQQQAPASAGLGLTVYDILDARMHRNGAHAFLPTARLSQLRPNLNRSFPLSLPLFEPLPRLSGPSPLAHEMLSPPLPSLRGTSPPIYANLRFPLQHRAHKLSHLFNTSVRPIASTPFQFP